jgi:hypothetical protein
MDFRDGLGSSQTRSAGTAAPRPPGCITSRLPPRDDTDEIPSPETWSRARPGAEETDSALAALCQQSGKPGGGEEEDAIRERMGREGGWKGAAAGDRDEGGRGALTYLDRITNSPH